MTRKVTTVKIGNHRLRIRKFRDHWQLWLMGNESYTAGTFIQLTSTDISKVTQYPDGSVDIVALDFSDGQ